MDRDEMILTAIGPDRIGLVELVSKFISRHGCNIEDSKMAVFSGEFAVIVLISGDAGSLAGIAGDHRTIEAETGLSVTIKRPSLRKPPGRYLPYLLTASCMDHPGVVYQISGILSSFGVNVQSMETKTYSAPMSGGPLFQLEASLAVPAGINIHDLAQQLEELQREENIDIELSPIRV